MVERHRAVRSAACASALCDVAARDAALPRTAAVSASPSVPASCTVPPRASASRPPSRATVARAAASCDGAAMIMVACVMAIVLALCLALLLVTTLTLSSAQTERSREQCRIWAVSLSDEMGKQITDTVYSFENQAQEDAAYAAKPDALWFYLRHNVWGDSWPYYNEDERGHSAYYAQRTFHIDGTSTIPAEASDVEDAEITLYWESEAGAEKDGTTLVLVVTCTSEEQVCTVTSEYTLTCNALSGYEQWLWTLSWRE